MKKYTIKKAALFLYLLAVTAIANSATCPDGVAVNITGTSTACGSVSLTAAGAGGATPYSYLWNGGSSTGTAANTFTSGATYSVVVTDGNGCTASAQQAVTVNAYPTPGITGTATGCGSVSLTATGGGTYTWSSASTTNMAANTFTTLGTYTVSVTVTGSNTCSASTTQSVTVNGFPTPSITGSASGCAPVALTAHGGTSYAWSGGNNTTSAVNNIISSGGYTVTVTDANSCTASASASETVLFTPSALITPGGPASFCAGGTVLLTAPSSGAAVNFSSGGYISATGADLGTGDFTVEAWIYPTGTGRGVIVAQGVTSCATGYVFQYNNNTLSLLTATGGVCQPAITSGPVLTLNHWQHVAVSVTRGNSGNLSVIYVNGMPVAAGNVAANSLTNTSLTIGSSSGFNFNGIIDEVRVYNTAITQTNIQSAIYSIVPANSTGLVSYFRLDEGTGTITVNLATGANGTFNGSPAWMSPSSAPLGENIGQNIIYNWSTGAVSQSILVNAAGSYVVQATSTTTQCKSIDTINVTVNAVPVATVTGDTSLCPSATLHLFASGATTYSWNGPGGFTSTQQNPTISSVTTAATGLYSVTVTTAQGCNAFNHIRVTVHPTPIVTASNSGPICVGSDLHIHAAGGRTYVWSGPGSLSAISPDTTVTNVTTTNAGTYHVTVTDINGCSATTSTTAVVNTLPTPGASSNGPVCSGAELDLTGTGGTSYIWSGPGNYASASATPVILNTTAAAGGAYNVTATDANGCSATASVSVTVNGLPTATAGSNSPLCVGSSLSLNATGGVSYSWSGPSYTSTTQNPTVSNPVAGTYTVRVTDINSCTANAFVQVTINNPPVSPSASNSGPVCSGGTFTLTSSNATSYQWSGPNGFFSTQQNPVLINVVAADSGTYTVIVSNNGCTATASTTATVHGAVAATATNNAIGTQCAGENVYLFATGGVSYQWSGPIGFSNTHQNDTIIAASAAASGTYSVTVTNATGCSATASTSITIIDVPAVAISGLNDTICAGETLNLTANGGVSYSWSGPNNFTSNQQDVYLQNITVAGTGIYTVTATNSGGCLATAQTLITVDKLPVLTSCPGNMTVNADAGQCSAVVNFAATATGVPNAAIWYSKNPGTVFPLGTTNVLVGAYNGCGSVTCNFNVTVVDNQAPAFICPANIAVLADEATNTKTIAIGVPVVTDNCGVASLTNSFNNTASASGIYPAGITSILWTATDVNGNVTTCTQTVTVYPHLVVSLTGTNSLCPGTFFGSVTTQVAGGQTPYSYHWSNGSTAANISGLPAASYTVTVVDAANNTVAQTYVVQTLIPINQPATPGPIAGPAYVCVGAVVTYSVVAVPATVSYTWVVPTGATIVSGQGTNQISVRFPTSSCGGYVQVAAVNCQGSSYSCIQGVSMITAPLRPGSISGSTGVCAAGAVYQYNVPSVSPCSNAPSSYTWTAPTNAVILSGQGTNAVSVKFNAGYTTGTLSVIATNCAGTSTASTLTVAVSTHAPTAMNDIDFYPSLNEPGAVCPHDTLSFTVNNGVPVSYVSTYNWTAPANASIIAGQGTQYVTVVFNNGYTGGNLTVTGSNCTGTGAAETQSLPLNTQVPGTPCTPSGNAYQNTGCPGDTLTYSISPVNNARSYTWTAPPNTTIISGQGTTTVSFVVQPIFSSGNLSVYASNCSGNGSSNYQFIDISNPTGSPCNLNGPSVVCAGFAYNYTVGAASGDVTSYVWTVPTGATIVSGQGTQSVYISFQNGYTTGTISVVAMNCIISSSPATQTVSLATQAPVCSYISGTRNICIGDTVSFVANWVNNATAYTWTIPAHTTLLSGQGSTNIVLTAGTGYTGGTLSVVTSNCIGNGPAATSSLTHINCGVHGATGIDEVDATSNLDVSAYPNPFNGQFFLKAIGYGSEPVSMKIFDITGKLVEENDNLPSEQIVAGNKLESGVYLIQVRQGNDTKTLRMVKLNN